MQKGHGLLAAIYRPTAVCAAGTYGPLTSLVAADQSMKPWAAVGGLLTPPAGAEMHEWLATSTVSAGHCCLPVLGSRVAVTSCCVGSPKIARNPPAAAAPWPWYSRT